MVVDGQILVGKSTGDKNATLQYLALNLANRHGLVAGATGTGKTVTLQLLAEGLSKAGVSVFASDVKGDLSGIAFPGEGKDVFLKRAQEIGVTYTPDQFPVIYWDVFGEKGHPVRATVSEMGPLLLARLLQLNDTQEGMLNIAFRVADDNSLPIIDLKDLRALLEFISDNEADIESRYGNLAKASIGTIQRQLLVLENQGADKFLGEPALELTDFIRTNKDGRGAINILAADKLMANPRLYASFLVWMLSELFEALPEVGDLDKPKLVFFFDEAHLLFDDAPKALLDAVQRVVRLIRSKGVGVFFVTQNPLDVPDNVLAQLGNRAQHALRAFTPRDQKAVRAAADTFRQNPAFSTEAVITQLGVGEALVSMLQQGGTPAIVERTLIAPPSARVGPITDAERQQIMAISPVLGKYDRPVDRDSAYEMLARRKQMAEAPPQGATGGGFGGLLGTVLGHLTGGQGASSGNGPAGKGTGSRRLSTTEAIIRSAATSAARSIGTQVARAILRNALGGIIGGNRSSKLLSQDRPGSSGTDDFLGEMSSLVGKGPKG